MHKTDGIHCSSLVLPVKRPESWKSLIMSTAFCLSWVLLTYSGALSFVLFLDFLCVNAQSREKYVCLLPTICCCFPCLTLSHLVISFFFWFSFLFPLLLADLFYGARQLLSSFRHPRPVTRVCGVVRVSMKSYSWSILSKSSARSSTFLSIYLYRSDIGSAFFFFRSDHNGTRRLVFAHGLFFSRHLCAVFMVEPDKSCCLCICGSTWLFICGSLGWFICLFVCLLFTVCLWSSHQHQTLCRQSPSLWVILDFSWRLLNAFLGLVKNAFIGWI